MNESTSKLELTQGYWAIVDTAQLALLQRHNWCVHKTKGKIYAKTQLAGRTVYMHRLLVNAPTDPGLVVDHRNGDGLDNRRCNLRIATWRENARNSPGAASRRVSAVRGVTKREHRTRPWRAHIYDSLGFKHLGYFETEAEAVAVRVAAEKEIFGEFAWSEQDAA